MLVVLLLDAAEEEHLVVHREAEHDREQHHRHPRLDRAFLADADEALDPAPLEDRDDHAVRRADRQQVHDHGLERHEQRSEHEHQQHEAEEQDREEHVGQALPERVGEVDADRGLAADVHVEVGARASPRGSTSSRSRCTSCVVLSSCGEPFGTTWISTPCRSGSGSPGSTCCDARDPCAIASPQRVHRRRRRPAHCTSLASSSGPLKPGPEALDQQVVGAAGRELRRVVAGVGDAEAQRDERDREDQQDQQARRSPPATAGAAACGSTGPRSCSRRSRCLLRARQRELVDRVADEAEHRGQQRDRGGHHEQHRERRADREAADERHADQEQAEH